MGKLEYKEAWIFGAVFGIGGTFGTWFETEGVGYYYTDRGESL